MPHEETLFVVVRIDEPASDTVCSVAPYFTRAGIEDIHPVDLHPDPPIPLIEHRDIGLSEDHEQVPLAGILEFVRHVQIGIHPRFQHRNPPELAELRRMRLIVERTGYQHIEIRIPTPLPCTPDIRARYLPEFRTTPTHRPP